ncbi:hypothetical protein [Kordia sp.]|uniref:hypothetical protein n=1 Tax=Kordia sp. TaxID=1965332 RepID=UPI003B5BBE76
MKKEELIEKLAGNSFKNYLSACDHLKEYIQNGGELNQEIIERALAVNLLPLWASHDDFEAKLEEMTEQLPQHSALLENEDMKHHLMGLSVFVNGLINGTIDVSGFIWCSNGYICCNTSCESISEYYKAEGKEAEAAYFHELSEWFMSIYSGTTDVFRGIMEIKNWDENMIVGLKNFLNGSLNHYGIFEWILAGLYNVVDEPLIQEKVFEHYIKIFEKSRATLRKQKNKEAASDITNKLKNLRKLAKGKSI